jgi:hypothetical protein
LLRVARDRSTLWAGDDRYRHVAARQRPSVTLANETSMLEELITSGRIVDIMIAFVIVEVAVLMLYRRISGRGVVPYSLLVNVGAGGSLMLALRAVYAEANWTVIAACLVSSLVFHTLDIADRWQQEDVKP